MPIGIGLRRIAQHRIAKRSIGGRYSVENLQTPYQFPPGSYTFTVPKSGYWKFVGWGPGASAGGATGGGGSGAYIEITKPLAAGQTVAVVVGATVSAADTTLTFPDGVVATAGKGANTAGGTASGGDVNLNGSAGGATGGSNAGTAGTGTGGGVAGTGAAGQAGGAGAPGTLPWRGGKGGSQGGGGASGGGTTPAGGAAEGTNLEAGGDGQVIAYLVRE